MAKGASCSVIKKYSWRGSGVVVLSLSCQCLLNVVVTEVDLGGVMDGLAPSDGRTGCPLDFRPS